jgi:fibronectin type 3 domain-containing protein
VPDAPSNLLASPGDGQVSLTWSSIAGAAGYRVYRSSVSGGPYTQVGIATSGETSYMDTGLVNGTRYYYVVTAVGVPGTVSPYSNEASAMPGVLEPPAADLPLAGLALLLRPDDLVLNDSEPVLLWNDASSGQMATAAAEHAPSYVAVSAGGRPAVRFDGSSDYLKLDSGFSDFTSGLSIFVVGRFNSETSGSKLLVLGNGASNDNISVGRAGGSSGLQYVTFNGEAATWLDAPVGIQTGAAELYEIVQQGGAAGSQSQGRIYKNGSEEGASSFFVPNVVTRSDNYIGWSVWGDELFAGEISEVIVYNRALTEAERLQVEVYLEEKYGISTEIPPPSPLNLAASPGPGVVTLTWTDPPAQAPAYVRISQDGVLLPVHVAPGVQTYTVTGLTGGETYTFEAVAFDSEGSPMLSSNSVQAVPAAPPPVSMASDAFNSPTLSSFWRVRDGFAAAHPHDTDDHATLGLNGSQIVINIPGGAEHNMWWLEHTKVVQAYDGQANRFTIKMDSPFVKGQQFGLVFENAEERTFLIFMLYYGEHDVFGYAERFVYSGGVQHKETFPGEYIHGHRTQLKEHYGAQVPGPLYLRVTVFDHTNPKHRSWKAEWSQDGIIWGDFFGGTHVTAGIIEGEEAHENIGRIARVGLFAGNQVPEFSPFTAAFDYFEVATVPRSPINIPQDLQVAGVGDGKVRLTWLASIGASGYKVHRSTASGGPYTQVADLSGTEFTDTGLINDTEYYYVATAYHDEGESAKSNEIAATPSASQAPAAGLPADGLYLHLRAEDLTLGESAAVTNWTDRSGAGHNATAQAGHAPSFVEISAGGRPAVLFDGQNDYLQLASGFTHFTQGMSVFVVARFNSTSSFAKLLNLGNGMDNDNIVLGRVGSTDKMEFTVGYGTAYMYLNTPIGIQTGTTELYGAVQQGGSGGALSEGRVYKNGIEYGTNEFYVPDIVARSQNYIGKSSWEDALLHGEISEIVIYNRALSASERTQVENYLTTKYGILAGSSGGGNFSKAGFDSVLPGIFALKGNYPNPFTSSTQVVFDLPEDATVAIEVFDIMGRRVLQAPPSEQQAGTSQSILLDASSLPSGTYIYRLRADMEGDVKMATGRLTVIN